MLRIHRRLRSATRHRRSAGLLAVALAVTGAGTAAVTIPARAAGYSVVNNDAGFVQVYDANVENLPRTSWSQCAKDWQDLVYYMKTRTYSPDLYLVQQLSGKAQLQTLLGVMNKELAGSYDGIVAENYPTAMTSPCGANKKYQTNAIIWRTDRFTFKNRKTWKSRHKVNGKCVANPQSRTLNVAARLYDKKAGKYLTAVSMHWPTATQKGPSCAGMNILLARDKAGSWGSPLQIIGGDANTSDFNVDSGAYKSWYEYANGDRHGSMGLRDVIYQGACAGVRSCLDSNWTLNKPGKGSTVRMDFMFARKGDGALPVVTDPGTITFAAGNRADKAVTGADDPLGYSDHRAIRARIWY